MKKRDLENWDDVNRSLKEIGECKIAMATIKAETDMKINDANAEAEKLKNPIQNGISTGGEKDENTY